MSTFLLGYALSVALTWALIRFGFHIDQNDAASDDKTVRFWSIILFIPFYNVIRITYTLFKMWNKQGDSSSKIGTFSKHFFRILLVGNKR